MEKAKLLECIGRLAAACGKDKPFNPESVVQWEKMCATVPGSLVDWIVDYIAGSNDGLPFNLGKAICDAWTAWKIEHPEKISRIYDQDSEHGQSKPCDDCNSEGYMIVRYFDVDTQADQQALVLCGSCQAWRKRFGQIARITSRQQLEREGYRVIWPELKVDPGPKVWRNPAELVGGIGRDAR